MIYNIVKYMFGIGATGTIDRVAFWTGVAAIITFAIAWIAAKQLSALNITTKGDFAHKFTRDFFNEECRRLITLFNYDLLKFQKPSDDEGYAYFELDRKSLDKMKIDDKEKEKFKQFYSTYDIDDELLGHFEDIGNYEKEGLLNIKMVYEGFASYIDSIWDNKEIKACIDWQNSEGDDIYEGFRYIYNKLQSYSEAKNNKKNLCIWEIKWRWRTLKSLYRKL